MVSIGVVDGVLPGKVLQKPQGGLQGRFGIGGQDIPGDQDEIRLLAMDCREKPFVPFPVAFIVEARLIRGSVTVWFLTTKRFVS